MAEHLYTIDEIGDIVCEIAQRYGVERVALFGSYARGEARPDSDIDLRIDKGRIKGLFQLSGFQLDLEDKLKANVDVLTTESLNIKFLNKILQEEVIIYEE
jgi:predicted nucleotidyltransferase